MEQQTLKEKTVFSFKRRGARRAKLFISFIISFFLAAQAFAGLIYHPDYRGDSYFPFLNYPMYSGPHKSDDMIPRYHIFGIIEDGSEIEIKPGDLRMNVWEFFEGPVQELKKQNASMHRLRLYVDLFFKKRAKRLVGLRLENHPLILSKQGIQEGRIFVLNAVPLGRSDGSIV